MNFPQKFPPVPSGKLYCKKQPIRTKDIMESEGSSSRAGVHPPAAGAASWGCGPTVRDYCAMLLASPDMFVV